ncbi:MAG: hypothetical protein ABJA78_03390 [Ferruginibacter sp.]
MKKITGSAAIIVLITAWSCSNQPAEVKKEVIVVPEKTIVVEKKEVVPEKNTSVSLDKNGIKVTTKKVDVTIDH